MQTIKEVRATSTVVRKLVQQFKSGYRLTKTGSDHHGIVDPEGNIVRDASGRPLTLPSTPHGDYSHVMLAQLRKAGVIGDEVSTRPANGQAPPPLPEGLLTKKELAHRWAETLDEEITRLSTERWRKLAPMSCWACARANGYTDETGYRPRGTWRCENHAATTLKRYCRAADCSAEVPVENVARAYFYCPEHE